MSTLACIVQWSEAIIGSNLWITAKLTDQILDNNKVTMESSCMQGCIAIFVVMFWTTFVFSD